MTARYLSLALLLLLCTTTVLADGIIVQSPTGTTMDPAKDRFGFSVDSGAVVQECRLLIDDVVSKTVTYNAVIKGRTISFAADYEDGDYTWSAACELEDGTVLASSDRTITIKRPTSVVTVTSSGAYRGSMLHSFTMRNAVDQVPIEISKVAAGDYISITLAVYPSKSTKELYVKSRLAENGVAKVWFTHKQEDYYVTEGENVTIPITASSSIILGFPGLELNRIVLVAYPNLAGVPPVQDPAEETPEPAETPEPEETPVEEVAPETPTIPAVPVEDTTSVPEERPGGFQRFLSWLVGLFGA